MCVFKEVAFPYVLGRSMDHLENTHEIEIKQSFWIRGSISLLFQVIIKIHFSCLLVAFIWKNITIKARLEQRILGYVYIPNSVNKLFQISKKSRAQEGHFSPSKPWLPSEMIFNEICYKTLQYYIVMSRPCRYIYNVSLYAPRPIRHGSF